MITNFTPQSLTGILGRFGPCDKESMTLPYSNMRQIRQLGHDSSHSILKSDTNCGGWNVPPERSDSIEDVTSLIGILLVRHRFYRPRRNYLL